MGMKTGDFQRLLDAIGSIFEDRTARKILTRIEATPGSAIARLFDARRFSWGDFMAILSDRADRSLDRLSSLARSMTRVRFGETIQLYVPLYISSHCVNDCLYCWFGSSNDAPRKTLSIEQIELEARSLHEEGFRSILLVSGEAPKEVPVGALEEAIGRMKEIGFFQVAIEVGPMSEADYRRLGQAGLDGVTLYQETYDQRLYERLHRVGPKRSYRYRLESADRIGAAGIRNIGVGFLLGLGDFRTEALALAEHVSYLNRVYWESSISISFPRLKNPPDQSKLEDFVRPVSDNELIRLLIAFRFLFPEAGLTLSTRESAALRDKLFGVGISQASAGSKTAPGAYRLDPDRSNLTQFPVTDSRSMREVAAALVDLGFEPVFKDWERALGPVNRSSEGD